MEFASYGEFLPEELQFLAEETTVTIVPKTNLPGAEGGFAALISGRYGPFQPNTPVEVPLWLAVALEKKVLCTITPPPWLQEEELQAVLDKDRERADVFQQLPYHYVEIAALLTRQRPDLHKVKDLAESIRKVRSTKLNAGLRKLDSALTVQINNVSAIECNTIKPFLQGSLDRFYELNKMTGSAIEATQTQPSAAGKRQLRR